MITKVKTSDFYDILKGWLEVHGFPLNILSTLSFDGLVHYNDDNVPTHYMSVYHTNSYVLWIGYPISNPTLSKKDKKNGLKSLLLSSVDYGQQNGYKVIFTTTSNDIITKKLISCGFLKGDSQVNHYLKTI